MLEYILLVHEITLNSPNPIKVSTASSNSSEYTSCHKYISFRIKVVHKAHSYYDESGKGFTFLHLS